MNTNRVDQMELRLGAKSRRIARQARQQRRQRAQFWFAQMRKVVATAMEWRPEAQARPAQIYLEIAGKRP